MILNDNVFYKLFNSPLGKIYILGDEKSLKGLHFKRNGDDSIEAHMEEGNSRPITAAEKILSEYFSSGEEQGFTISRKGKNLTLRSNGESIILDLSDNSPNEITVYEKLTKVKEGKTISYGELAEKAGFPRGSRFVGNTMAKNPFPILVPCHRVIKSDGSIGNYGSGVDKKRYLLNMEGASDFSNG